MDYSARIGQSPNVHVRFYRGLSPVTGTANYELGLNVMVNIGLTWLLSPTIKEAGFTLTGSTGAEVTVDLNAKASASVSGPIGDYTSSVSNFTENILTCSN